MSSRSRSSFNTSKVRLEGHSFTTESYVQFTFQYLEGAIRGLSVDPPSIITSYFQYLEGAIRGNTPQLVF